MGHYGVIGHWMAKGKCMFSGCPFVLKSLDFQLLITKLTSESQTGVLVFLFFCFTSYLPPREDNQKQQLLYFLS